MKISNGQITERITFNPEIDLQVFFAGVANGDLPDDSQKNWPMKSDQERHAYGEAGGGEGPTGEGVGPRRGSGRRYQWFA